MLIVCTALLAPSAAAQSPAVEARLAAASLLLDGTVADGRTIVVGQRGHVLFSDDGGVAWTQARVPVQAMLTAVHMVDGRTGWAVGHDAVILGTRDGGETWRLAHRAPQWRLPLLDVWFRDPEVGFAVGAFGTFLTTTDGGESWTCRNGCLDAEGGGPASGQAPPLLHGPGNDFEDDFHLNAIAPAAGRRLYLAGEAGALYRSDDDGVTWRALPSPYHGSWFGALALDADTVLVAGLRGHMFRSEDSGETWARIDTATEATLTDLVRTDSGLIVVTGLAGALLTSRDDGRTVSSRPLPSRQGISTAVTTDAGVLLIGESGITRLAWTEREEGR